MSKISPYSKKNEYVFGLDGLNTATRPVCILWLLTVQTCSPLQYELTTQKKKSSHENIADPNDTGGSWSAKGQKTRHSLVCVMLAVVIIPAVGDFLKSDSRMPAATRPTHTLINRREEQ